MESFMSKMLFADLIPILVIMAIAYISGKKNVFQEGQSQVLNKLVLDYALPAALFISIVKADREMLFENATLSIISLVGLVSLFMLSYYTVQWFFKRSKAEGAVCALVAGSPTIGFLGYAILDPLFGTGIETGLVVAIVAIVVNAVTIPIGLYLLNAGKSSTDPNAKSQGNALLSSLKQPVVWAPILAVLFVLIGIKVPTQLDPTFKLLAQANSSVAVFAAGLTLAAYKFELDWEIAYNTFFKLILMPGIFLAAGLFFNLSSLTLQMLVLGVALPPAFSGVIISGQYNVYTRQATSSLAVSVIGFIIAAPAWVYLAKTLSH
ncbi:transporter YfdV [Sphingobacterium rhinopitheci]|uniref:transporter YfdV n=1 Tax=Sphingobacterium rhinopitheci TaxID=2781960 RepID=UPI001F5229EF|nr:transporter YfdV [Sphingobacterium rhinopitheci]MCI0922243.1 transporter YfdV [Sphingobacterium rhinopitheci]